MIWQQHNAQPGELDQLTKLLRDATKLDAPAPPPGQQRNASQPVEGAEIRLQVTYLKGGDDRPR
jgi:hypothetical protein